MRATSKRLCFMASMARSKRTLSGCFEPTLARGLLTFLFVQAAVKARNTPNKAITGVRRIIETSEKRCTVSARQAWGQAEAERGQDNPRNTSQTLCSVASVAAFNNLCALVFGSPLPNTA